MSFYQTTILGFAIFYSICGFFTRNIVGEDLVGRLIVGAVLTLFFYLSLKFPIVKKNLHRVALVLFTCAVLHYCHIWLNIHEQNRAYDVMYFLGFLVIAGGVFQAFIHLTEQVILGVIFILIACYLGTKIELMPLHFFLMNFLILLLCCIIVSIKIKFTNKQITEQIQKNFILSKSLDSQKQTGKIINSLAHEINNPLAIISGTTYLLRAKDSEVDMKYLDRIDHASSRINKLIKLMGCYLPQENKSQVTDVHTTLLNYLELQKTYLSEKGLFLKTELKSETVLGSIEQGSLVIVLEHLLNNAFYESLKKNEKCITVSTLSDDKFIHILISNVGKIADESKLFLPFSTSKDVSDGMGLGLYTCKFELEKSGGEIHLTRNDGVVEFTVSIKRSLKS